MCIRDSFNVALPRVRDFRGINPNAFDGRGNYALGLKEQLIFPEIEYDKIDQIRGMDIIMVTTANKMCIRDSYDGKLRRQGYTRGRTSSWKKAIVTLKEGSKGIEFFESLT